MKEKTIKLSPKHGVNPSLMQCYVCMKDVGVAFVGRLPEDKEAPRKICLNEEPCDECKEFMKQGIILISVRDGEGGDNPYRTGCWCVVKEDYIRKTIDQPEFVEYVVKKRMAFVPDPVWDMLGLPRKDINNEFS